MSCSVGSLVEWEGDKLLAFHLGQLVSGWFGEGQLIVDLQAFERVKQILFEETTNNFRLIMNY